MPLFDEPFQHPEKEPTPERKWWSAEKLTAEKAAEQAAEKEKNDRARELKQAAKKRGQELEEHQPEEAQEIAPKGEKLRKKWRRALLKKSQQVMEFFRKEEPETIDGVQLAELMVAERIMTLNQYLETTEPKTNERRSTKTELDFMGLLSEKISDATIDVPLEIEKVYQQIIARSAEVSSDAVDIDIEHLPKLPTLEPESTQKIEQNSTAEEDRSKVFARHGAVLLAVLGRALHKPPVATALSHEISRQTSAAAVVGMGAIIAPKLMQDVARPMVETIQAEKHNIGNVIVGTSVLTAAVVHEVLKPELPPLEVSSRSSTTPLEKPLSVVPQAENLPTQESPTPASSSFSSSISQRQTSILASQVPESSPSLSSLSHESSLPLSGKRIEDMTLQELLFLASSVAVGNGQYLKRAYETGQIDREGLVSVLKSRRLGLDYQSKFRLIQRQYREGLNVIASTPEVLSVPNEPDDESIVIKKLDESAAWPEARGALSAEASPPASQPKGTTPAAVIESKPKTQVGPAVKVIVVGLIIMTALFIFFYF